MTATLAGDVADHREVVGDEEHREAELALHLPDQVEHRALDRDVERRGDLVGDDDLGPAGERAGQRDALPLAAGELAGQVRRPGRVEVDQLEQPGDLGAARRRARASRAAAPRRSSRRSVIRGSSEEYGSWNTIWTGRCRPRCGIGAPSSRIWPPCDRREADGGPREGRLARARTRRPGRRPGRPGRSGSPSSSDGARAVADRHVVEAQLAHRASASVDRDALGRASAIGSPACQQATRLPAASAASAGPARGSGRSASGQRAANAQPTGTCAGVDRAAGDASPAGRRGRSSMSGTAATRARV